MNAHDSAALRACLYDIDFPATRGELLRAAIMDHLHPSTVEALTALRKDLYRSGFEVLGELSALSVPAPERAEAMSARAEAVGSTR